MSPRRATPARERVADPRAVRVVLGLLAAHAEVAPIIVEPASGVGVRDGMVVDGDPVEARLDRLGPVHGVLVEGRDGPTRTRTQVILMPVDGPSGSSVSSGIVGREVVVEGWRIEVEIESERHASLRERASRLHEATGGGGPTEVRAIIPGRVVSVSVGPAAAVVAGQQLLVVEAMKMQNELRAPRDGVISRVVVAAGATIEVGDLLLVLD